MCFSPLALTHCAFKLGSTAWSLCCSRLSGGSWYIRLLLRLRRRFSLKLLLILRSADCTQSGGDVSAKLMPPRCKSVEDSLAVLLLVEEADLGRWDGRNITMKSPGVVWCVYFGIRCEVCR